MFKLNIVQSILLYFFLIVSVPFIGSPFKVKITDPQSKVSVSASNPYSAINKVVSFGLHGLSKDSQNHSIEVEGK